MNDLGTLSYFMVLEISSSSEGYCLSWTKYTSKLLTRARFNDNKIADTC